MSAPMETVYAELCWEALENVPRLPSYAQRAIERLKAEFWRARNSESAKEAALGAVKEALVEAEGEIDPGPPVSDKAWRYPG